METMGEVESSNTRRRVNKRMKTVNICSLMTLTQCLPQKIRTGKGKRRIGEEMDIRNRITLRGSHIRLKGIVVIGIRRLGPITIWLNRLRERSSARGRNHRPTIDTAQKINERGVRSVKGKIFLSRWSMFSSMRRVILSKRIVGIRGKTRTETWKWRSISTIAT
jgi:hypothetical protein